MVAWKVTYETSLETGDVPVAVRLGALGKCSELAGEQ